MKYQDEIKRRFSVDRGFSTLTVTAKTRTKKKRTIDLKKLSKAQIGAIKKMAVEYQKDLEF